MRHFEESRAFIESSLCPFVVLDTTHRKIRVVLLSKGLKDYMGLCDDDIENYIERFKLYPEYFIYDEDLYAMRMGLRYIYDHRNEEMRVRFRFHLRQEDPYVWFMSYGQYFNNQEDSYLMIELHNIENEQRELRSAIKSSVQSHALLEKILDTTQTNIFWKDNERRFLGANKAFLQYYGFTSLDDILGKTDEDMGWHNDPGPFKNDEERVIKYGESTHRIHVKCVIRGRECDIVASKAPLYIDGEIAGLVGSFEDVSSEYRQQKEIQKLNGALQTALKNEEKANKAKSEFMARMSHDMRTPLTTIIGLSELALKSDKCQDKETMSKIMDASHYLLELINDVLSSEKFDSGKMKLYADIWDHDAIMSSIYNIVKPSADRNKHTFVFDVKKDVGKILIDRKWLMQILINILNNAIKYTCDGGRIEWHENIFEENGQMIMEHEIRDNGVGISKDFVETKLYEPFTQEHNPLTKSRTSNGLGLSIVKKAVDLFGGSITCHSELGVGTTFILRIPFGYGEEQKKEKKMQDLSGRRVLICEDVAINAMIVKSMLESQKVEADIAEDGLVGLQKATAHSYDMILMDMQMPRLDGLQTTKELRRMGYRKPIITLSANTSKEDMEKCQQAGMNDFLEKPVTLEKLVEMMQKYVGKEFV